MLRCRHITSLFLLLWAGASYAQTAVTTSISGTVYDAETGEGLPGAHVLIAGSLQGTVTDGQGDYRLENVRPGAMRLYASMLGYAPAAVDTVVRINQSYAFTFKLAPTVVILDNVTVVAERDEKWARRYKAFRREFIGTSVNADSTHILNPEVLSFEGGFDRLLATASEPLVVENRALGYHITYFLRDFIRKGGVLRYDGEPLFHELEPINPEEAQVWAQNRERAFYGSFRHFLQTLLARTTRADNFRTAKRPNLDFAGSSARSFDLDPRHLLRDDPDPEISVLAFSGVVEVTYLDEIETRAYQRWSGRDTWRRADAQRSWIRLTDGPTRIDQYGEVIDPYGVTIYGFFAFERVADQLPKEYQPPTKVP